MGHNWPSTLLYYDKPIKGHYLATTGPQLCPNSGTCHLVVEEMPTVEILTFETPGCSITGVLSSKHILIVLLSW